MSQSVVAGKVTGGFVQGEDAQRGDGHGEDVQEDVVEEIHEAGRRRREASPGRADAKLRLYHTLQTPGPAVAPPHEQWTER